MLVYVVSSAHASAVIHCSHVGVLPMAGGWHQQCGRSLVTGHTAGCVRFEHIRHAHMRAHYVHEAVCMLHLFGCGEHCLSQGSHHCTARPGTHDPEGHTRPLHHLVRRAACMRHCCIIRVPGPSLLTVAACIHNTTRTHTQCPCVHMLGGGVHACSLPLSATGHEVRVHSCRSCICATYKSASFGCP